MLASDRIAVTDALRDVVDATLRPDLPLVARPLVSALNLVTVGLVPERLRDELDMKWDRRRARLLEASRVMISAALPILPRIMRDFPPARSAERRVRRQPAAA